MLLLRRDDNIRMSALLTHSALMQGAVISRVVCEECSSGSRSDGQMVFILTVDHVCFGGCQHVDVAHTQAEYEGSWHSVLVQVEPHLAHWRVALDPSYCSHWN